MSTVSGVLKGWLFVRSVLMIAESLVEEEEEITSRWNRFIGQRWRVQGQHARSKLPAA